MSASVHRVQNNPAVTQLHVLTNGDLLPHQIQHKPTNRGWGIPHTRGIFFMEETWPELRTAVMEEPLGRCCCLQACFLKLQLPLSADQPQTKTQLWLLLHRSSLSTEVVSVASAWCEHLGGAQGELSDAKTLPRCHPQGKKNPTDVKPSYCH